jgi:hypothetical protein
VKWPTATQAAIAAVTAGIVALILRRSRPTRLGDVMFPAATEFALVASLYSVWRVAKKLPLTQSEGAVERAREIVRLQDFLHLPSELSLQQFALAHDQVGWLSTAYYAVAHVPATIIFLVWLFVRHRNKYPHWRNALAILTAFCLFIRFVHVAPPRFLTDLGYIDLSSVYGMSVYGPVGTGVSGQFVAMPSLHVAWAGLVTFGVIAASTSKWRYLIVLHLAGTLFVVAATGHHWWLDGVVALVLLWVALRIDTVSRRIFASAQATPTLIVDPRDHEVASATTAD